MKRFISFVLCLLVVFIACACADTKSTDEDSRSTESTVSEITSGTTSETASDAISSDESNETQSEDESVSESEPEEDESTVTPLFWKATDSDGDVIWMLGSIHVGIEEYYPLPNEILDAYKNADALAVECDIVALESDYSAAYEMAKLMVYTDGSKISDHIDSDVYEAAVEILTDNNMYMSVYDSMKPVMWFSLIENLAIVDTDLDVKLGIDMFFLKDAKKTKKTILEVESAVFQYEMLAGFSPELQEALLVNAVNGYKDGSLKRGTVMQVNAWGVGDEELLTSMAIPAPEQIEGIYEEYWQAMMIDRNVGMADFCEEKLEEGKEVFVVVGLAHFLGDDGIVALLRERGYTVEKIG